MDLTPYVIIIVAAIAYGVKDVIKALADKVTKRLNKESIVLKNHPLFNRILAYKEETKYKTYTQNGFKQEVIRHMGIVYWDLAYSSLLELAMADLNKLSNDEFDKAILEAFNKIDGYVDVLKTDGVSEKTINVMHGSLTELRIYLNALVFAVKNDKIYDSNTEKCWSIFTIYMEYILFANKLAIALLTKANGSLIGEAFKGITNEEDKKV